MQARVKSAGFQTETLPNLAPRVIGQIARRQRIVAQDKHLHASGQAGNKAGCARLRPPRLPVGDRAAIGKPGLADFVERQHRTRRNASRMAQPQRRGAVKLARDLPRRG